MAMTKKEIQEWLNWFKDDDLIGINEGGLILEAVEDDSVYIEVGGIPDDTEGLQMPDTNSPEELEYKQAKRKCRRCQAQGTIAMWGICAVCGEKN